MRTERYYTILAVAALLILTWGGAAAQSPVWQPTAGPLGGYVTAIARDSNGVFFAAMYGGGLHRSTDNGRSWRPAEGPFADVPITVIAAGQGTLLFISTERGGIYRSTDNGVTWLGTNIGMGVVPIRTLVIEPNGIIFAGTSQGLFRSTNNGDNWSKLPSPTMPREEVEVSEIASIVRTVGGDLLVGSIAGIHRSTDNGASWTLVYDEGELMFTTRPGIVSFQVAAGGEILAGEHGSMLRSTDNGVTWKKVLEGLARSHFDSLTIGSFAMDATGRLFAAAYNGGVYSSTDNGATWNRIDADLRTPAVMHLMFDTQGELLATTTGDGIERSTDGGVHWSWSSEGLVRSMIERFLMHPSGDIVAITTEGRLFRTTDRGDSWLEGGAGLPVQSERGFATLTTKSGDFYMAISSTGLFRSTDRGASWSSVTHPDTTSQVLTAICEDSTGAIHAARYGAISRSTDGGLTWSDVEIGNQWFSSIAAGPNGMLYAGTNMGFYRSTDYGVTWTLNNEGFGLHQSARVLGVNWQGNVFVERPPVTGTGTVGVFRSSDQGVTWTEVALPPERLSLSFVFGKGREIFAHYRMTATYHSTDDGASWTRLDNGFSDSLIWALDVATDGKAYAGTYGYGVWRASGTVSVREREESRMMMLEQNHPNPADRRTSIRFELAESRRITLALYDRLGAPVATLVDEHRTAGRHDVTLDLAGLLPGVYFYRLSSGEEMLTRAMIVTR